MTRGIALWIALVLVLLLLPAAAAAQTSGMGPFVSTNASLPGSPTLVGLTGASYAGPLGIRASSGVRRNGDGFAFPGFRDAWVADVDVSLAPTRLWRGRGTWRGLEPVLFIGIGLEGGKDDEDGRFTVPSSSYGGALWYPLTGWLRLESDARRRAPIGNPDNVPGGVTRGWEFRLGLAVVWSRGPAPSMARGRSRTAARAPVPPPPLAPDISPEGASARLAASVLRTAEGYLGTPYRFGGTDPLTGLDCSAFVQRVYRTHGLTLPRTSRQQAQLGRSVDPRRGLQPGDLLFFASNGSRIDHVALYAGDNTIIHATGSGREVRYDDLSTPRGRWFANHLVAARRIIGTELADAALSRIAEDGELDPPDLAPPSR